MYWNVKNSSNYKIQTLRWIEQKWIHFHSTNAKQVNTSAYRINHKMQTLTGTILAKKKKSNVTLILHNSHAQSRMSEPTDNLLALT
jgi:hypothetical protein